jgi:putative copper export protein
MKIQIEDLLGRVALIGVGVFFGGVEMYWLLQLLADPWGHDSWPLDLLVRLAGFLFMALIAVTTFIRLPAKNTAPGCSRGFPRLPVAFL